MSFTVNRKRAAVAGAAVLLLAGISTGGALVTKNSTIFDNLFQTEASDPNTAEMVVTGSKMTKSFSGAADGEIVSGYYTVENKSATKDLKFNVGTQLHPTGTKSDELAAALDTQITPAGQATIDTGKLKSMSIPTASQITVPAGSTTTVRVDVLVKDSQAFQALNLGDDAETTVDYRFDSIFLP